MNYTSKLSLVTLILLTTSALAQTANPPLQQGIHVQMAPTHDASPMPDADNADAWIITVTADGSLYFGTQPMTSDELIEHMKVTPRRRDQMLYVKADGQTSFAYVNMALDAARIDLFETAVLLTSQHDSSAPGVTVPPMGLEVSLKPSSSTGAVLGLHNSNQQLTATINHEAVRWADLQNTLKQHLQNQSEKVVALKADGQVPFVDVAHAVDACRSLGAQVVLSTAQ
jgi:biopolymer transport protein ExbD